MEHLGSAGYDEGDGLDVGVGDGLEAAEDLVLVQVDTPFGKEGDAALWLTGLVLGEVLELVVFVFVVADVAVTGTVSSLLSTGLLECTYPFPARYKH